MKNHLTLIFVLTTYFCSGQQNEEKNYQLEFSGGASGRSHYNLTYNLSAGVNVPAKKDNWYTNYALQYNHRGNFSPYSGVDLYSLSAGKHYHWTKNRFYSSLGANIGLFHSFGRYAGSTVFNATGLAVIPRAEIGLNTSRFIFSVGASLTVGYGYGYERGWNYKTGSPDKFNRFTFSGLATPYLKITIK